MRPARSWLDRPAAIASDKSACPRGQADRIFQVPVLRVNLGPHVQRSVPKRCRKPVGALAVYCSRGDSPSPLLGTPGRAKQPPTRCSGSSRTCERRSPAASGRRANACGGSLEVRSTGEGPSKRVLDRTSSSGRFAFDLYVAGTHFSSAESMLSVFLAGRTCNRCSWAVSPRKAIRDVTSFLHGAFGLADERDWSIVTRSLAPRSAAPQWRFHTGFAVARVRALEEHPTSVERP
jgi:hypothetical protein